jgi:RsiW-degrading membrane proteinase PrsW (M82 family)
LNAVPLAPRGAIGIDGFLQPTRAAFWLLLFFLANGLYAVVRLFMTTYAVVPEAMATALVVWALYALPFLLFLRHLDIFEQQSRATFVLAFAWGGLGAVYLAIPANDAIFSLASKLGSPEFKGTWGAAIAGPTTEEFLKTAGIVLLVLVARTQFLTPLSVVATGAMVGLGFQIVENVVYSTHAAAAAVNDDQLSPVLSTLLVRGFMCGLWSHAVYSAIAAYGVAEFMFRRHQPLAVRVGWFLAYFALAWGLHAAWNSPLLSPILSMGTGGAALFMVAKGLPVLLAGIWIWRMALRQQSVYLEQVARQFVPEPALITADERSSLIGLGSRRDQRKATAKTHGWRAAHALHELQRRQLRLLLACMRFGRGPATVVAEAQVADARAALAGRIAAANARSAG